MTPIPSSPARWSPASTARSAAAGAYFGQDVRGIVESAARRAAARRRLELRGRERLDAVVVQHHDLRARGPARVRTGRREQSGGDRGPPSRAGVPPRTPPLPPAVDRRGDRARSQERRRLDALRLPDLVALRRAAGARLPASGPRRARRTRGRGDRAGRVEARRATAGGRSRSGYPGRTADRDRTRAKAGRARGTPSAPCASSAGTNRAVRKGRAPRQASTSS